MPSIAPTRSTYQTISVVSSMLTLALCAGPFVGLGHIGDLFWRGSVFLALFLLFPTAIGFAIASRMHEKRSVALWWVASIGVALVCIGWVIGTVVSSAAQS